MGTSDLEQLIDMGFDKDRAEIAAKKTGNLQEALDWLEKNQDKSIGEIIADNSDDAAEASEDAIQAGKAPSSWMCNECGKKFRTVDLLQFHANKSGHSDFAESTEEIAPLTEEEKKQRLEELKAKAAARRAEKEKQDKIHEAENLRIRNSAKKDNEEAMARLKRIQAEKEVQEQRRQKKKDAEHLKSTLAKIEEDKRERRRKAEEAKAARAGQAPPAPANEPAGPTSSGPVTSKPASAYTEARLRLQTPGGVVTKTFPAETTLFEVAHAVAEANGTQVNNFTQTFPKKTWDQTDFGMTVKEAGWLPSAALIAK